MPGLSEKFRRHSILQKEISVTGIINPFALERWNTEDGEQNLTDFVLHFVIFGQYETGINLYDKHEFFK